MTKHQQPSTNDQAPMTNQKAMTNVQWRIAGWALLFRLRFRFIGHWCLVIDHFRNCVQPGRTICGVSF
jgi:hypothetical protein